MPYDEAKWRRESLEHYLQLAAIDVPRAVDTALTLAGLAEGGSCGGLTGLVNELRQRLGLPEEESNADRVGRPRAERRRGHSR